MSLMSNLREKYYGFFSSDDTNRKKVRKLLNIKVKSPFDENQIITLGDIVMSTTINEYNIIKIAESYGIKLPSEAVDIGDNAALKYLLYHGKNFQYSFINEDGKIINKCIDELDGTNIISEGVPLIPKSYLEDIIHKYQDFNESYSSFFGHSFEYNVTDQLRRMGYDVFMPSDSNNPGYDLIVSKKFFEDNELNFVPYKENSSFGLLQVKTTSNIYNAEHFTDNTLNHFEKYPDIPVIASEKICDRLIDGVGSERIISFSDIGIDEFNEEVKILETFLNIKDNNFSDVMMEVKTGLDVSQFSDAAFDINNFCYQVPWIGIGIKSLLRGQVHYRLFKEGKVEITDVLINCGKDIMEVAVIGTATKMSTATIFSVTGMSLLDSTNSIYEGISSGEGIDIDDLKEFGLCLAIVAGVGYLVKQAYKMIFGDPKKRLNSLIYNHITLLIICTNLIDKHKDEILDYFTPQEYIKNKGEIILLKEDLKKEEKEKIKSLVYFVKEYKVEIIAKTILEIEKILKKDRMYINNIIKVGKLLEICKDESKNINYIRDTMLKIYNEHTDEIKCMIREANTFEMMRNVILQILNAELKKFLEKIKYLNIKELNKIYTMIEDNNTEINKEIENLKNKGKL